LARGSGGRVERQSNTDMDNLSRMYHPQCGDDGIEMRNHVTQSTPGMHYQNRDLPTLEIVLMLDPFIVCYEHIEPAFGGVQQVTIVISRESRILSCLNLEAVRCKMKPKLGWNVLVQ
jgi:hypothetical protein